jgi:hypothetical protein
LWNIYVFIVRDDFNESFRKLFFGKRNGSEKFLE